MSFSRIDGEDTQEFLEGQEDDLLTGGRLSYSKVERDGGSSRDSKSMVKRREWMNIVVGSGSGGSDLVGERRVWLYLGRLRKNTSVEKIKDFLNNSFCGIKFEVENLNSQGRNESFKLGTDFGNLWVVSAGRGTSL